MLTHLDIRNIVLIDHVALGFQGGLSVLTGETGAGKSILLDALGLLRGDRADGGLVRQGEDQASVSAMFDLPDVHPVRTILGEQGILVDDQLVLRRVLGADGKSRAFVNDQAVTVGLLRTLGRMLVDIHGQFDTSDLFDPAAHRRFVDAYGELQALQNDVAHAFESWRAAKTAFEQAVQDAELARREEDYLRAALADLDDLAPEVGEEESLLARKQLIAGRAQIVEGLTQSLDALSGDAGAEVQVAQAARAIERLRSRLPDETMTAWLSSLDVALAQVREVTSGIDKILFDTQGGDVDLDALEDRLYALRGMARRHGCLVDDLPLKRQEIAAQLSLIDRGGEKLSELARIAQIAQEAFVTHAAALSVKRKAAAKKLDAAVMAELPPLKLEKAKFETQITSLPIDQATREGMDAVRFVVATNPGSAPGALDKIASGGEISRLMLALKVVLAERQNAQLCMIFDEVDSGIGGAVAAAVAERLARLAGALQVLAVTHAPQVAARAQHHFIVAKGGKGNVVTTRVTALTAANDRREEIARMLSGEVITDEARAAAQKLLDSRVA